MEVKNIPLGDLIPYEKNAKKHPAEQIEHIANSLKQFGWKQPLVIDKNNVVIVGHGRLLGAKKLGLETAPCIIADDLTDDEIKAYRLADNKLNESEWDLDLLDFELGEIELDMSEFGFDLGFGEDELPTQTIKQGEEINLDEYEDDFFECECPKCGFRFNRK